MSTFAEYEKARDAYVDAVRGERYVCEHADRVAVNAEIASARSALDAIVRAMAEDGERWRFVRDAHLNVKWADAGSGLSDLRPRPDDYDTKYITPELFTEGIDAARSVLPLSPRTQEASNAE